MLLDGETNLSGRTVSSAEFMYIMIRFVVGSGGIQIVTLKQNGSLAFVIWMAMAI